MDKIKLIALDLDGTLFDNNGKVSPANINEINRAIENGTKVVISTGRPFIGIPFDAIKNTGIRYAITTNGSAIYEIPTEKCLHETPLDDNIVIPIIDFLMTRRVHMDAFISGKAYSPKKCLEDAKILDIPAALKHYIINTRERVDSIPDFIRENGLHIQKMTLNFPKDENGHYIAKEEVSDFLLNNSSLKVVSGGYGNLEFTMAGVDKGVGLNKLAQLLDIPIEQTMAVGDTENDLAIIKAARIGVAMGNATDDVKAASDYITDTNENDGVAKAISHFLYE